MARGILHRDTGHSSRKQNKTFDLTCGATTTRFHRQLLCFENSLAVRLLSSDTLQEVSPILCHTSNNSYLSGEQTQVIDICSFVYTHISENVLIGACWSVWCDDMLLWMEGFKWLSVLDTGTYEHWLLEESEAKGRRSSWLKCGYMIFSLLNFCKSFFSHSCCSWQTEYGTSHDRKMSWGLITFMCWKRNFHWTIHVETVSTGPDYLRLTREDWSWRDGRMMNYSWLTWITFALPDVKIIGLKKVMSSGVSSPEEWHRALQVQLL